VDKNWMTEEAAAHKYCPKIGDYCLISECMFWEWREPEYRYAVESPGEGWVKGETDDWAYTPATDPDKPAKPQKYEWHKERDVEQGKCGIRC
jgi:hypothetical protein